MKKQNTMLFYSVAISSLTLTVTSIANAAPTRSCFGIHNEFVAATPLSNAVSAEQEVIDQLNRKGRKLSKKAQAELETDQAIRRAQAQARQLPLQVSNVITAAQSGSRLQNPEGEAAIHNYKNEKQQRRWLEGANRQIVTYLGQISPSLFPKEFETNVEGAWARLQSTDLVLKHSRETWNFLVETPNQAMVDLMNSTGYSHSGAKGRMRKLVMKELKSATEQTISDFEMGAIDLFRDLQGNWKALKIGAQQMGLLAEAGFSSEAILKSLVGSFAPLQSSKVSTLDQRREKDEALRATFNAMTTLANRLPSLSPELQSYLISDQVHGFQAWPLLLWSSPSQKQQKLIEPVQAALKTKMADNKLAPSIRLQIAEYFLVQNLYREETEMFLKAIILDPQANFGSKEVATRLLHFRGDSQ